jgi:hypothetical protein
MITLLNNLDNVSLSEGPDEMFMRFGPSKQFSVKSYQAMNWGGVTCLGNSKIWNSLAPKKVYFFAWLALHNRLSTRDRLASKGIILEATCPFGCNTEENIAHLLFHCPHTSSVCNILHFSNVQALQTMHGAITNSWNMPVVQEK